LYLQGFYPVFSPPLTSVSVIWLTNCIRQDEEGGENMNWTKSRKVFLTGCRVVQALVPAKRKRQIISSLLVALFFGFTAQAQTGDWQAVQNLKPGSYILVKAQHRYRCSLESATDDELICEGHLSRSLRLSILRIPRSEIHEVRKLPHPNQAKDAWIGAGIGAGAGAVVAGTNSRDYPGVHAFFGGLAGAAGGALVGGTVPIFQVIFQRGKLIYKQ
jgi:hypothetical protein